MTENKQINICEFFNICETDCDGTPEDTEMCSCYKLYKQLARKEQECEGLKHQIEDIDTLCDERGWEIGAFCYENKKQRKEINKLQQELNQLKAENEELNTVNARLLGRLEVDETNTSLVFNLDRELRQKEKELYIAIQKVAKLKQALKRIKDFITQINVTIAGDNESPKSEWIALYKSIVYEVSKIISEVEND